MNAQPHAKPRGEAAATAALSIGAAILLGMIGLAASGVFDRPASADQAAKASNYSAMTASVMGGNRELLFLIDDLEEKLLVYDIRNNRSAELATVQDLPTLFVSARGAAGFGRRP